MTEHEVKALKSILDQAKPGVTPNELDQKILLAADEQAAYLKAKRSQKRWMGALREHQLPINLGPAVLSITMTAMVFFGLSKLFTVSPTETPVLTNNTPTEIIIETANEEITTLDDTELYPSDVFLDASPLAINSRDQILAEIQLPSTDRMLQGMQFDQSSDRLLAMELVTQAMVDIRSLLVSGEFNRARNRFEQLRERCDVCTLPKSLEVLVLNDLNKINSG